jgi:hypothetical protein
MTTTMENYIVRNSVEWKPLKEKGSEVEIMSKY